jgi:hypothetical protein
VALTKLSAFACVTLSRNRVQTLAGMGLEGIRKNFSKNFLKGIDSPREAGYISNVQYLSSGIIQYDDCSF